MKLNIIDTPSYWENQAIKMIEEKRRNKKTDQMITKRKKEKRIRRKTDEI